MDSTKTIQVNIPSEIQEKIDSEEYKRKGNVVRDKQGQIVCHLDSLDVEDGHYFSPSIFVSFQSYAITSVSMVSMQLQNDLKEYRAANASINGKLNRLLSNQTKSLNSSIANFEEHFNSLLEKSSLTDEKEAFTTGTKAASDLAAHLPDYIKDYLGETVVFHDRTDYKGETYSTYLKTHNPDFPPTITKSKFAKFANSEAHHFVYAFINIINNINILSLCYDSRTYRRYEDNLRHVRTQLVDLLSKATKGLGNEGDIYDMCYSTNEQNNFRPVQNLEKLLNYSGTDIHQVIQRRYGQKVRIDFDDERISTINNIIWIIDDIDNLLKRSEQISEVVLKDLPELAQIKKLLFIEE